MEIVNKIKEYVARRQQAYQQVFNPDNIFLIDVMEDLEKFCRIDETTFHPDQRVHALLEGRREVLLRIKRHVNMDTKALIKYYTNKGIDYESISK